MSQLELSRIVETASGRVIDLSMGPLREALRNHVDALGVSLPRKGTVEVWKDDALVASAMSAAGWACLRGWTDGTRGHAEILGVPLRDAHGLVGMAVASGLMLHGSAELTTTDVGTIHVGASVLASLRDGDLPYDDLLAPAAARNAVLNRILTTLSAHPVASTVTVFGSVARSVLAPGDVDAHADLTGLDMEGQASAMSLLIRLARRHYGHLDPFVDSSRFGFLVRDEEAQGWEPVTRARAMRSAIRRDGVPIASVRPLPDTVEALMTACGVTTSSPGVAPR